MQVTYFKKIEKHYYKFHSSTIKYFNPHYNYGFWHVEHAGYNDKTVSLKVTAIWHHHEFYTQKHLLKHPAAGASVKFQFLAENLCHNII